MAADPIHRAPPGRLRVLVVTHTLSGGGAERFASTLLSNLDRDRFAPSVCLVKDQSTYPIPSDVAVSTLGYRGIHHLPQALLRLRRRIATERPDVVLSNVLSTNCLTGGALRGLSDPPPWVARIGLAPEQGEPLFQRLWARRCYPLARAVVSNSERMLESFVQIYPETRYRCRHLPNPTDFERLDRLADEPSEFAARSSAPRLIAIGRLTQQKRPDLLLEALARVRQELKARLWLFGEGPLRGRIESQIRDLGLADAVELLGFRDNPFPAIRRADLFVLTSDYEGLPNALIEAQGLGLPAVATRCPYGPDEIVRDGETGRLVPTGDSAAIGRAIAEILEHPSRRQRMAEAASRRARQKFGLGEVIPRWEELLIEAATDTSAR